MKFHHFRPPWKNRFGYPWKNPLLDPLEENSSDAHDCGQVENNCGKAKLFKFLGVSLCKNGRMNLNL